MKWVPDAALDHLRRVGGDDGARYELGEELGRGGMGVVYRARDRELDRDVALKLLDATADAGLAERLRREARILARLEHPGIVPVHDVGVLPDGRLFYAMKLVRGERLDEWAARTPALADLLRAFTRACEAVAFAHAQGVLHRDLKPHNVMVGAYGEVLVMDWGVARLAGASDRSTDESSSPASGRDATAHGTVLGTPGFMAPEQARGETERVGVRSDVYALGAVLGTLLDGHAERSGDPVPRPLAAIRGTATDPEPGRRYADAVELAADVSRWLDRLPVAAYREGPLERARRIYLRFQTPILLVLAYLLMRVLLLAFG